MDGQNKKLQSKVVQKSHGLRLIKGGTDDCGIKTTSPLNGASPSKRAINPLVKQLSALADAIDQDVAQILKL